MNGENYSRTSNVSESIHSSLNKEFNRKVGFQSMVQLLSTFKKKMIVKKAAFEPINLLNLNPRPSKKKFIERSDVDRLRIIHEKVRIFSLMSPNDQIQNLKNHLIDIGGQRRNYFRNNNIVCRNYDEIVCE